MPPIQLLIKPASGACNLRCKYCFYADIVSHWESKNFDMMSIETLDSILKQAFILAENSISIAFQGGEPTLIGLSFYQKYIELINQYNSKNLIIQHAIQTNGILLNEEWAAFLAEHNFLVGLSIDGTRSNHDRYRVGPQNKGSFSEVWSKVALLKKYNVKFNILTVVTADTAHHIRAIYPFYVSKRLIYQQYIPCLNPLDEPDTRYEFSLTPDLYGDFLCDLFDMWFVDLRRGRFVYIQYFDNLVAMLKGLPPITCGMTGVCTPQLVVESDGSFYPCDFYVLDKYCLGNIQTDTLAEIDAARYNCAFLKESLPQALQCKTCPYFYICRGGCRRHREPLAADHNGSMNYFCKSYKRFFDYSLERLKYIAVRG